MFGMVPYAIKNVVLVHELFDTPLYIWLHYHFLAIVYELPNHPSYMRKQKAQPITLIADIFIRLLPKYLRIKRLGIKGVDGYEIPNV